MRKDDRLKAFCRWYVTSKSKNVEDYDKNCKPFISVSYNTAMNYLLDEECQQMLKETLKARETTDMIEIYSEMKKQALDGNVKSAEYCQKFFQSAFFDNSKSAVDKILDGLDIEE